MIGSLPPLDPGAVPREVRAGGPEAVDRFRSALGFERMLLGELLQTALPQAGPEAGPQPAQLHDTLADALVARGGIGLGADLYAALTPPAAPYVPAAPAAPTAPAAPQPTPEPAP